MERMNQTVKQILRKRFAYHGIFNWTEALRDIEYNINHSVNRTTKKRPIDPYINLIMPALTPEDQRNREQARQVPVDTKEVFDYQNPRVPKRRITMLDGEEIERHRVYPSRRPRTRLQTRGGFTIMSPQKSKRSHNKLRYKKIILKKKDTW
jgi:hypothetical protein